MKTLKFTDSELEEFKHLLKWAIAECLDDSLVCPFEEEKQKAKEQANVYKKLYNKIIKPIYKEDE